MGLIFREFLKLNNKNQLNEKWKEIWKKTPKDIKMTSKCMEMHSMSFSLPEESKPQWYSTFEALMKQTEERKHVKNFKVIHCWWGYELVQNSLAGSSES